MQEDWKAPIREALLKEGDVEKLKTVKVYSGCNGLGIIYIYIVVSRKDLLVLLPDI